MDNMIIEQNWLNVNVRMKYYLWYYKYNTMKNDRRS